jgi:hypothetical protein
MSMVFNLRHLGANTNQFDLNSILNTFAQKNDKRF